MPNNGTILALKINLNNEPIKDIVDSNIVFNYGCVEIYAKSQSSMSGTKNPTNFMIKIEQLWDIFILIFFVLFWTLCEWDEIKVNEPVL